MPLFASRRTTGPSRCTARSTVALSRPRVFFSERASRYEALRGRCSEGSSTKSTRAPAAWTRREISAATVDFPDAGWPHSSTRQPLGGGGAMGAMATPNVFRSFRSVTNIASRPVEDAFSTLRCRTPLLQALGASVPRGGARVRGERGASSVVPRGHHLLDAERDRDDGVPRVRSRPEKLENNARRAGKPGTAPIMRAFSFLVRVVLATVLLPLDLLMGDAVRAGDMTRPLTGAFGVVVAYGAFRAAEVAVGIGRASSSDDVEGDLRRAVPRSAARGARPVPAAWCPVPLAVVRVRVHRRRRASRRRAVRSHGRFRGSRVRRVDGGCRGFGNALRRDARVARGRRGPRRRRDTT